MANEYQVAQISVEVLDNPVAPARVSQLSVEVLDNPTAAARLASLSVQVLRSIPGTTSVSRSRQITF